MRKALLIIIIFLGSTCVNAQVFSKFYDYKGINDLGSDVLVLKDGYLTTSASVNFSKIDTFNYAQTFLQLIKYNKEGIVSKTNVLRIKNHSLDIYGTCLINWNDTTYLNIGRELDLVKYQNDSIGYSIFIVKYNNLLDTISTKSIKFSAGNNTPVSILKRSENSIFIFGQECVKGKPIQDCDYFLTRLDSNFNVVWKRSYAYDPTYWENPESFVETEDKGFLLFGYTSNNFDGVRYWYLVKTDSVGNKQWQKKYFKNSQQLGRGITKTLDGNYLLCGSVETIITGGVKEYQGWLIKIDPIGNTIWERIYGSERFDFFRDVLEKPDSSILISGYQTSDRLTIEDSDEWVLKFDKNGNKLWERVYNNYSAIRHQHPNDLMYSMKLTDDGGSIMAGYSYNPDLMNPTQDLWILKLDSFGCLVPGCQGVGIEGKRISAEEVLIYPNPAKNFIKLSHREKLEYYKILNVLGKVVQEGYYNEEGISLNNTISSGHYLLYVQFESEIQGYGRLVVD